MYAKSIDYEGQILIKKLYNICPYTLCDVLGIFIIIFLNIGLCTGGIYLFISSLRHKCDINYCRCTYSHKLLYT